MKHHIAIIKWAAGAAIPLPDELEFDTSILLNLVEAHKLSRRFVHRIYEENVNWVTSELLDGLQQLNIDTKQQVIRNIEAFRGLKQQLKSEAGIILIKGVSTYVLSEKEITMRAGDIDLLSNNTDKVVQTLLTMGYLQTRSPFLHEIGEYTKGATEFDIHAHFPLYSYSPEFTGADLIPLNHTGIWQQNFQMRHNKITFADLEKCAILGKRPDTRHVLVPDPNLLAIIICSHAFMNYTNMWSISHREKAYVRLGEIADLYNLVAHPLFRKETFLAYTNTYQATDAVEWAASIAVSVFGKNPLPVPVNTSKGDALNSGRFPRCLWWNFWADLPSETDDLLRTWWLSMDWMTEQLGANYFLVCDGQTANYSTVNMEDALPLKRYITQLSEPIPLLLNVKKSENGLVIKLQVRTTQPVDFERVRVDFGNIAIEWIYAIHGNQQTFVGCHVISSFMHHDAVYELTLEFTWESLDLSNLNTQTVALLIGVARQTNLNGVFASTLIPVVIEC